MKAELTRKVNMDTDRWSANNWIFVTPGDPNNPWQFYNWNNGQYQRDPDSHLVREIGNTNQFVQTISGTSGGGGTLGIYYHGYDGYTEFTTHTFPGEDEPEGASLHSFYLPGTASHTASSPATKPQSPACCCCARACMCLCITYYLQLTC